MADYTARLGHTKNKSSTKSWKLVFAVFLTIVLLFAALNGIVRARVLAAGAKSGWDGVSSFLIAINADEDYLAILQNDPKRFVAFKLGDLFKDDADETEILKTLSFDGGALVKYYLVNSGSGDLLDQVENFKSYLTPIKIIFGGFENMSTNVSRFDAFRLWWKTNSVGINDENIVDISANFEGSDMQKVMGINSVVINRAIKPYVENLKVLSDDVEINIVNKSEDIRASKVMEDFIVSIGGRVTQIIGSTDLVERCQVIGSDTYTREYLAKTFDCDIKDQAFGDKNKDVLTVVIGQEFRKSYL
ncbi:MAG: hypothetical protein UU23_C0001G0009 [Candidatus Curtissbacteria bacterium GW2011_GWA1_40_9]|uniref:LytR/CpsA/Psr regulator C-terminal domain-containing protein n=1 Tax=Candidatus Curtissbacteria bacterium GW2011_GWA1_40_9 TaxID=1618408 RepID=A0A0G0W1S7_9BACT|nr:MAG: hypothetical protein UU23_C0001G0009 [Candidatus Curtissbacteria bacterium GW2011_GWA1_40_9]